MSFAVSTWRRKHHVVLVECILSGRADGAFRRNKHALVDARTAGSALADGACGTRPSAGLPFGALQVSHIRDARLPRGRCFGRLNASSMITVYWERKSSTFSTSRGSSCRSTFADRWARRARSSAERIVEGICTPRLEFRDRSDGLSIDAYEPRLATSKLTQ